MNRRERVSIRWMAIWGVLLLLSLSCRAVTGREPSTQPPIPTVLPGGALQNTPAGQANPPVQATAAEAGAGFNQHFQRIGQIGGNTYAVELGGRYAYVGVGPRLVVLDLANAAQVVGASAVLPGVVRGVRLRDRYAFVAAGDGHLRILDVTDPAQPVEIAALEEYQAAMALALDGDRLYVADNAQGLWIVDVADPQQPRTLGSLALGQPAAGLAVSGSYVYLTQMGGGLTVVDITNPQQPRVAATLPLPQLSTAVIVSGSSLFVAAGMEGLWVLDVSNPSAPRKVGGLRTTWADGIALDGATLFLTDTTQGLLAIDVSNPASPAQVGALGLELFSQQVPGQRQIAVQNGQVLVANQNQGLLVINTANPAAMGVVQTYSAPLTGAAFDVVAQDGLAYVTRDFIGLGVVDVQNPAEPFELGSQVSFTRGAPMRTAWKMAVEGRYVYQADVNRGFRVLDAVDPAQLQEAASIARPGSLSSVVVQENRAYVSATQHDPRDGDPQARRSLRILDISNPLQPRQLGMLKMERNARMLAVQGSYVYYPDAAEIKELGEGKSTALHVIDAADPANPAEIAQMETTAFCPLVTSIVVSGGYAYLGDQENGLCVVDISDPRAPRLAARLPDEKMILDLELVETRLFAAAYAQVLCVDVSVPTAPRVVDRTLTPGLAWGITAREDLVYVADLDGGLVIFAYR